MDGIWIFVALLVCHYLADFCLTSSSMIAAKADGRKVWPILLHAGVHAGLVGVVLLFAQVGWELLPVLVLVELVSHFLIDTAKGRLSARFQLLTDAKRKPYWMLYGFDQLLHLAVLVWIWNSVN